MTTRPLLSGLHMHGHKNGLKTLLKLGPILWSGADDGCIRHDGHLVGRKSVFFSVPTPGCGVALMANASKLWRS